MKKINSIFLSLFLLFSMSFLLGCNSKEAQSTKQESESKISVAVSIVPEETFVKKVGKDKVNVFTLIPPGQSPANYAPTTDVMKELSDAALYFSIGVPTEKANILPKIADFNKDIKIINMAEEVSKVYPERKFASGQRDPHIWISPKRAKVMVEKIAVELGTKDPKNKDYYTQNAKAYMKELDKLDQDIKKSLEPLKNKQFICYHPAFGYFAEDYGLEMIALEKGGKPATPEEFTKTIDLAKEKGIKVIFYQAEMDSKQAKSFADEVGGKCEMVAPLSADYVKNLNKTAKTFEQVLEGK